MEINGRLFKIAYKKLKSSLYYDKTQSIVRDQLVNFESEQDNLDEFFEKMAREFSNANTRNELFQEILNTISYYSFPKSLETEEKDIIKNYYKKEILIKENQCFIEMDIRGHILGVLWLILIGYRVDKNIYTYSYGNRIRKNLYNEFSESPTFSPYLFEPYFQQYEGWRDKAMDEALTHLHNGQDIIILTLDFKRFYYSVDITKELMNRIYYDEIVTVQGESSELKELNEFIYSVIENYARKFDEFGKRNILPIGFLPSNVLSNYALRNFDKAILDGWNPIYFGRYVDDVIIVDKIEMNSDLFVKSQENELKSENVISYFLEQCTGWKGLNGIKCRNGKKYALLNKELENDNEDDYKFVLNKLYNPMENDNSEIVIKNDKFKIFYFKAGESDALITCFKENISKNKSEFRHMPEDEAIFQKDDYSKIYDLQNSETINKFRGITGISVNRFELSKLLGKHLRIGGLIDDVRETGFEKQIGGILNSRVIIENYNVWEKVVEVLIINESWEALESIVGKLLMAIDMLDFENESTLLRTKVTLYKYLNSILNRSLALVWGEEVEKFINELNKKIQEGKMGNILFLFDLSQSKRNNYCKTRMIDKSVMPIFIDMLQIDKICETKQICNLTNFKQMICFCKNEWIDDYVYYPYLVTMYDFSMISCIEELMKNKDSFGDLELLFKNQINNYVKSNYLMNENDKINQTIQVKKIRNQENYLVTIKGEKKNKIKIAIANVKLNHNNFRGVVLDKPNRSYHRYTELSKIINEAIDEKADVLIMPESYMPFEWLSTVARTCTRNNIAIISGVEHIKIEKKIFNLTAIILPYEDIVTRSAFISFHLKRHYAPSEKQEISGYRLQEVEGNHYELYQWHDCYFPVYCCYELTSITERAIFQSYADFLIAIEWNKDINYYSNILESLSRDIHCYCVQVNSSDYGDSRITKPSKTEDKNIMRTKGGKNSTILVDEIDIQMMREFQLKEYNLQIIDKRYKPTPPGFDHNVVLKKIKGENIL